MASSGVPVVRRGSRMRLNSAALVPAREAQAAKFIKELAGPQALPLLQEKEPRFLAGATPLYTNALEKGGEHERARGVLL